MFTVQCLNKDGELVHHKDYDNIFGLRIFSEGELVTKLARKEVMTVLIEQKEDKNGGI